MKSKRRPACKPSRASGPCKICGRNYRGLHAQEDGVLCCPLCCPVCNAHREPRADRPDPGPQIWRT
jgi:hypothetical protein